MNKIFKLAILNSHPIQYFVPLYRRLAREPQIDLTVYFCSRQGADEYLDRGFGATIKWDTSLLEGYRFKFLRNLRQRDRVDGFFSLINPSLVGELRRHRYDALWVHGHNYLTFLLGIAAANLLGIPVLMRGETHLLLRRSRLKRTLRRPIMRFFYNHLCTLCLPIGTRNREFYLTHGVPTERLFTVPYTVDNAYFMQTAVTFKDRLQEIRAKLGLPVDKPLILFASKLTERKRPKDLLLAFSRLREQGTDAALVFVGSGELETELKQYLAASETPDVYLLGFRNQSELPLLYAVSDIFVLPSENEPWGLILNEVMCAGLPVIATEEIGAVADLVKEGINGFTYPAGEIDKLTTHLAALVGDPSLRQKMGFESQRIISDWDLEVCVEGVLYALRHLAQINVESLSINALDKVK